MTDRRSARAAPSSAADRYVAELADAGKSEGAGVFTLDREVAEKKLRDFQLPDSDFYVLLLVQAALRQGAERIDITATGHRLRLEYSAPRLVLRDLELLYNAALGGGDGATDDRVELRRALGLGISVARNRVRRLELVSRAGADGVRLWVRPSEPDFYETFQEHTQGEPIRTHLDLTLPRFWKLVDHEVAVLRERCRYSAERIVLNGRQISHGLLLPEALAKVSIQKERVIGQGGFEPNRVGSSELRIVRDGVLIATHDLPVDDARFVALVEDDSLKTDLSGFDVVQDDAYQRLRRIVCRSEQRAQRAHRVNRLCDQWIANEVQDRVESLTAVRQRLRGRLRAVVVAMAALVAAGAVWSIVELVSVGDRGYWAMLYLSFAIVLGSWKAKTIYKSLKHRILLHPLRKRTAELLPPGTRLWRSGVDRAPWLESTSEVPLPKVPFPG